MKTIEKLPLRCLSGIPLLTEKGEPVEIIPYTDFKADPEGMIKYNIVNKEGYWHIDGYDCDRLAENVFQIHSPEGKPLILTVDWIEN